MGCTTSSQGPAGRKPPAVRRGTVRVLVAGGSATGKSSFARRFVHRDFTPAGCTFTRGSRCIRADGASVTVHVANVAYATQQEIDSADCVMLMVNGTNNAPFDGIYKYLDALYHGTPVSAACAAGSPLRVAASAKVIGSTALAQPDADGGVGACTSVSAKSRRSRQGSESMSLRGSSATSPDTLVLVRGASGSPEPSPHPFMASGSIDGHPSDSPSLTGFTTDCERPASLSAARRGPFARLRLRTEPAITPSFRRLRPEERKEVVDIRVPPIAVAVSMCDVLDEQADSNPLEVVRLRAMATNWSSANRCRVTFVSNKSGVGVNSALAHLIRLVYEQDEQRLSPSTPATRASADESGVVRAAQPAPDAPRAKGEVVALPSVEEAV